MKVAVCVPVHGDTKAGFTRSVFGLATAKSSEVSPQLLMFMGRGTLFPHLRNDITAEALSWGADWLLWLDADHTFPPDALFRLLAHGAPIVGCNYPRRRRDSDLPTATANGRNVYTTEAKANARNVEEVDTLGLGLCLIRRDVFERVQQPFFRLNYNEDGDFETEDVFFFRAVRAAGIRVLVDHSLSWEVGHIDEKILTNASTGRGYVSTILPSAGTT